MRQREEWKNPKTQNGGHETPVSISLSSHCARWARGCSGLKLPCLSACSVSGHTAQQELGGHILASGLSK